MLTRPARVSPLARGGDPGARGIPPPGGRRPSQLGLLLCEQAAQLAVKGLLHGVGRAPWGQHVPGPARRGDEAAGIDTPEEVALDPPAAQPALHPGSLPDAHPEGPPGTHYGATDSEEAVTDAELILHWGRRCMERARWLMSSPNAGRSATVSSGSHASTLSGSPAALPIEVATVIGSVARGDFNVWSDVDVLVVSEALPSRDSRSNRVSLG